MNLNRFLIASLLVSVSCIDDSNMREQDNFLRASSLSACSDTETVTSKEEAKSMILGTWNWTKTIYPNRLSGTQTITAGEANTSLTLHFAADNKVTIGDGDLVT